MAGDPCPVCGLARSSRFLTRESVPVHQNLLAPTRAEALAAARGDLAFAACASCGFVFNAAFDSAKLAYGAGYDNNQSHSPFFADYLAGLARRLVHEEGIRNFRIVEVGCGRGDFLRMLVEDAANGNTGVGFDPSYAGPEVDCDGRLRFERRYYDASASSVAADVVICRHVIEHVARPVELLRAVRDGFRRIQGTRHAARRYTAGSKTAGGSAERRAVYSRRAAASGKRDRAGDTSRPRRACVY